MLRSTIALAVLALALASCEQRDPLFCGTHMDDPRCAGDGGLPPGLYVLSGKVMGLTGSGLVLVNNGGDDKPIVSSGSFAFATPVEMGAAYDVTVGQQPTNPSEMCTVANGSGTVTGDVTDVAVTCVPQTYTVGGMVVGMTVGSVVLKNNGGDATQPITANGPFTFGTPLASGAPYDVEIGSVSGGAACTALGNMGTVGSGPVTTVVINCSTDHFSVGGTVASLNGKVKLTNNGADEITVVQNGSFAFPSLLALNATYNVQVSQQPSYPPAAQTCTVTPPTGMGSVQGNVVGVRVVCATKTFSIGGNVSGLMGTLVLKNGADTLSITANGMFTFGTQVASGATYAVTVMTQPAGLKCTVASPSGTVTNANITNVAVSCADAGVACGGAYCSGSNICCDPEGTPTCKSSGQCSAFKLPCDDRADCGSGNYCCADWHNGNLALQAISCESSCGNLGNPVQLCNPSTNECVTGTCQPWSQLPGYYACQ